MIQPTMPHVAHLLPAYVAGTLEPAERSLAANHLGRCSACRAELAAWEAIGEAVRAPEPAVEGAEDARLAGIWRRIEAGEFRPRPATPLASAATAGGWAQPPRSASGAAKLVSARTAGPHRGIVPILRPVGTAMSRLAAVAWRGCLA